MPFSTGDLSVPEFGIWGEGGILEAVPMDFKGHVNTQKDMCTHVDQVDFKECSLHLALIEVTAVIETGTNVHCRKESWRDFR